MNAACFAHECFLPHIIMSHMRLLQGAPAGVSSADFLQVSFVCSEVSVEVFFVNILSLAYYGRVFCGGFPPATSECMSATNKWASPQSLNSCGGLLFCLRH